MRIACPLGIFVANGNITFVAQFTPGTVDRDPAKLTWLSIDLDTDLNSATGSRERNGLGNDFDQLMLANGNAAPIQRYEAAGCAGGEPCGPNVGSCPSRLPRR